MQRSANPNIQEVNRTESPNMQAGFPEGIIQDTQPKGQNRVQTRNCRTCQTRYKQSMLNRQASRLASKGRCTDKHVWLQRSKQGSETWETPCFEAWWFHNKEQMRLKKNSQAESWLRINQRIAPFTLISMSMESFSTVAKVLCSYQPFHFDFLLMCTKFN